jgi:tRNA (mo5U34)-methyltransferase
VATDISDHTQWDWPLAARRSGPEYLALVAGPQKGLGFEVARTALGSAVEKREINVYDLSPEVVGEFDVAVCGSLLLHLKSPVAALEAIRSVCRDGGRFMSAEQIDPWLTLFSRRRPAAWVRAGEQTQWFVPNAAGHRALVESAGFEVERGVRPYAVPFGAAHPAPGGDLRSRLGRLATRAVCRGSGVPHSALLAHAVA